ncbi:hypothetical protein LB507_007432, partial [Fusarium sp. FIESC RH6]
MFLNLRKKSKCLLKTACLIMIPSTVTVTLLVIGHVLYLYYLDNKRERPYTRQQWVTTISNIFLNDNRSLRWDMMQRDSLTFEQFQVVASVPSLPISFRSLRLIARGPTITFAVILIIALPALLIWVPAALVVEYRPYKSTTNLPVSQYDFNFRGENDNSFRGIVTNSLCQVEFHDGCKWAVDEVKGLVETVLLEGRHINFPSPCGGRDCYFRVTMPGPAFKCQDNVSSDVVGVALDRYGNVSKTTLTSADFDPERVNYVAVLNKEDGSKNSTLKLDMEWVEEFSTYNAQQLQSLSCRAWFANYTFDISFQNGTQKVHTNATEMLEPIRASVPGALSFAQSDNGSSFADGFVLKSGVTLGWAYRANNIYALLDALVSAMGGAVSSYGTERACVINTRVLQSALAKYTPTPYSPAWTPSYPRTAHLNISGPILEDLLKNITLSLLSRNNSFMDIPVATINPAATYSLDQPLRLIPYGFLILVLSGMFALGFCASRRNGVLPTSAPLLVFLRLAVVDQRVVERLRAAPIGAGEEAIRDLEECQVTLIRPGANATQQEVPGLRLIDTDV